MSKAFSKPLALGVTGGIGSGKTSVCKFFSVLGVPVFSADIEAKRIQDTDKHLQSKINSITGKDLFSSGKLDRAELASIIFSNRELLEKVNSVVHPAVFGYFREWISKQEYPYSIMEAAILFESGAYRMMDRILTVVTPVEERLERIISGNKMTREQVIERMNNQIDDDSRIKRSDFVVYNSENDLLIPALMEVHETMLKLSRESE